MTRGYLLAIVCCVFIAALIPRVAFPKFYTITYDEYNAKNSGGMLDALKTGDLLSDNWSGFTIGPPYAQYLYGLLPQILFGQDPYDPGDLVPARMLAALMGSAIVVLTLLLGYELFDSLGIGVVAALTLAFFPSVLGHDRIAMHDLPSRLTLLLSWYLLARWYKGRHERLFTISAFFSGLALMFFYRTGIQNGISIAIWLCLLLLMKHNMTPIEVIKRIVLFGAVSLGAAFLLTYVLCPFAWFRPTLIADWWLKCMTTVKDGGSYEFWFGAIQETPLPYYFVVFLFCTPPMVLIGMVLYHWRYAERINRENILAYGPIIMFWISMILISFGLRQMLMHYLQIVIPFVCMMAAAGLFFLARKVARRFSLQTTRVTVALSSLMIISSAYASYSCSPFFIEYFNCLTGNGYLVQEKKMLTQSSYGEALRPLFQHLQEFGEEGDSYDCHVGPWPGIFWIKDYVGEKFYRQGYGKTDPLGPRYVLREAGSRDNAFYRWSPDKRFYDKVADSMSGNVSLGDLWKRKDDVPEHSLYYDDFSSIQSDSFMIGSENATLNPTSEGRFYSGQGGVRSFVAWSFPESLHASTMRVRVELDAILRNGAARVLAGPDLNSLRQVLFLQNADGVFISESIDLAQIDDLVVVCEWTTSDHWDGDLRTFLSIDCIDGIRILKD